MTSHHGRNSPEDMFAVEVANTVRTRGRSGNIEDTFALEPARCVTSRRGRDGASSDQTFAISFHATQDPSSADDVSLPIQSSGSIAVLPIQDAARPRGAAQNGMGIGVDGDPMYTMTTRGDHAVFAFDRQQITNPHNRAGVSVDAPAPTVAKRSKVSVAGGLRPRRLTPREVERLFGFADDYTLIPVGKRGKPAKDSPRYEALGNSMAVPVLAWIGRRLQLVDELVRDSLAGRK